MSEERKLALKAAILEWQKKHGIQDADPMLAAVELWEIYFSHAQPTGSNEAIPSFEEFRSSLEKLVRLGSDFATHGAEIVLELREVPKIRSELNSFPRFALVFGAGLALVAGILIGKFLL